MMTLKKGFKLGIIMIAMFICLIGISSTVFAETSISGSEKTPRAVEQIEHLTALDDVKVLNSAEAKVVLDELDLEELNLTDTEKLALLTSGTATVWDSTYKGEYNIKKSFSMTANLVATGTKPYTTFTIKNTGTTKITAIAYKGTVGGSTTIKSTTIAAGASKTFTITRNNILTYGTLSSNGTTKVLSYTVSLYNENGKAINCTALAKRYY